MNKAIILKAAKEFGTPFYLYDKKIMESSYEILRDAFPKAVEIFYSIKANPNIAICDAFRSMGTNVEVCSYYEIEAAMLAGFKPENMIFVGPAKSNHEIEKSIMLGINYIICESLNEFLRIEKLACKYNRIVKVALRINPSYISKTALLKMGGKASQFGMDEEIVLSNEELFLKSTNIHICGIHVYNGTRILDANTIAENTKFILDLSKSIQKRWKINFKMVDIGGGIGVPYFKDENEFHVDVLKKLIKPIINEYLSEYKSQKIILESGRFLIAKAGIFVSEIRDIKVSKGKNIIVTDGGTNCHMAAVGVDSLIKRNFPISLIKRNEKKSSIKKYNISGPLCTPNDLIGKQVELENPEIGDYIIVHNSGAYGPTASPVMFLSHGFPAEVMYRDNKLLLIRERFNSEDFFKKQNINFKGDYINEKYHRKCKASVNRNVEFR